MIEVLAKAPEDERLAWETQVGASKAPPPFDPVRPVSAFISDEADAIGLVRRGVRIVPFAEALPLIPLYAARKEALPAELRVAHEQQNYDFHLVSLTFTLALDADEAPDSAEFTVRIEDGVGGPRSTRAVRVFPERVHASWFRAEAGFNVDLDASLRFSANADPFPPTGKTAKASLDVAMATSARVLAGPFRIELGRTELEVLGEGDRDVGWRYKVQQALAGKNDYQSFLVLKVARETRRVQLLTNIGVKTYRRSWTTLWLRDTLPTLYAKASLEVELSGAPKLVAGP